MTEIRDSVTVRSLRASAPLLVWAAHWSLCYLAVAGICSRGTWSASVRPVLASISLVALVVVSIMLWRAWRRLHGRLPTTLGEWSLAGGAVLALAGIAWTSLPLLMVDGCR
jgi:hypothetical protein